MSMFGSAPLKTPELAGENACPTLGQWVSSRWGRRFRLPTAIHSASSSPLVGQQAHGHSLAVAVRLGNLRESKSPSAPTHCCVQHSGLPCRSS